MNTPINIHQKQRRLVYVVNIDWYFLLHWKDRALASMQDGWDVELVTKYTDENNRIIIENLGITTHSLELKRSGINLSQDIKCIRNLYTKLKEIKPDLVHSITIKPNIFCGLIKRKLKFDLVASITGMGLVYSGRGYKFKVLRYLINKLYSLGLNSSSTKVLFENNADLEYVHQHSKIPLRNLFRIHGAGVNTSEFSFSKDPDNKPVVVLFAARLIKSKGLEDLVRAIQLLKQQDVFVELLVAGIIDDDTNNKISEKTLRNWESEKLIVWLGQRDDVNKLITKANIIALPTHYAEGIPRILIEASASGRAVVTSNVAGCNEFVQQEKTGLIVKPHDIEELKNALKILVENPEKRKSMGEKGYELVQKNYTNENVIDEIFAVYHSLN